MDIPPDAKRPEDAIPAESKRFMLQKALEQRLTDRDKGDAFDTLVRAYYEEYTDAAEIDPQAYAYLQFWFDICFPTGEDADGREFDSVTRRPLR